MSELIDRAALLLDLAEQIELCEIAPHDSMIRKRVIGLKAARMVAGEAPTVAAAPVVHARWEKIVIREETRYREEISHFSCSRCKSGNSDFLPRYCSNCGARMDADAPERAAKMDGGEK